jgi:phenolic acid decarboxylase
LMTHIDPSEVVAHGAAVFARMTEEHPDRFTAYDGNRIPDDEYWAHEKSEGRWTPDDYMLLEHSELR